jgi:hypothetical protein
LCSYWFIIRLWVNVVVEYSVYVICVCADVFRNYFRDHGSLFIGAPDMTNGEHNMEYYALFQDYLKLYEVTNRLMCLFKDMRVRRVCVHTAYVLMYWIWLYLATPLSEVELFSVLLLVGVRRPTDAFENASMLLSCVVFLCLWECLPV